MKTKGNYKHGHALVGQVTKTYHAWQNMLDRCYNPVSFDKP